MKLSYEGTDATERIYRKAQMRILVCFCVLIVGISCFLSLILLGRFNDIIRDKTAALVSANSRQLELNINSYLDKIEKTATLLFSDEAYYLYDATDESVEEYDRLKNEELIQNRITDLGLMENFSDFGIVYKNDRSVGWLSNVTQALFLNGGMYETFSSFVSRSRTEDGWVFGVKENTDRLYYVKRMNPNAVLVVSFYSRELESVFDYPEELTGMVLRLVNEEDRILYSNNKGEIGEALPENVRLYVSDEVEKTQFTEENLINMNVCENGWRVICSIPLNVVLKESKELMRFTVFFALSVTLFFLLLALLIFYTISRSLDGLFSHLASKANIDELSGVLNKNSFTDQCKAALKTKGEEERAFLAIFDLDYFKQVNDNLGHSRGDEVIAAFGELLREVFGGGFLVGRVGGDEFAVFGTYPAERKTDIRQRLEHSILDMRSQFVRTFSYENQSFGTSVSAGVFLEDQSEDTYESMFMKADQSLYVSKENGKARISWYEEEKP